MQLTLTSGRRVIRSHLQRSAREGAERVAFPPQRDNRRGVRLRGRPQRRCSPARFRWHESNLAFPIAMCGNCGLTVAYPADLQGFLSESAVGNVAQCDVVICGNYCYLDSYSADIRQPGKESQPEEDEEYEGARRSEKPDFRIRQHPASRPPAR